MKIATVRIIEDFSADNVIYLELRSTLRQEPNMTKREYIKAMINGVEECESKNLKIKVKLIISINRKESLESAEENVDLALEFARLYPNIIVGIDVSGDPLQKKFTDFVKMLEKARKEGFKFTIHCGEVPDDQEISDILNFDPDRLGHCTCVHEGDKTLNCIDGTNWSKLLEKKIPVELCITSNVKCKTVLVPEEHHFKNFYKKKHPITLAVSRQKK